MEAALFVVGVFGAMVHAGFQVEGPDELVLEDVVPGDDSVSRLLGVAELLHAASGGEENSLSRVHIPVDAGDLVIGFGVETWDLDLAEDGSL